MKREIIDSAIKALAEKGKLTETYQHRYVAIPAPSLAVRYLLGFEGFPLSCLVQLVGQKSSFKSTLSLEIGRWHNIQDGHTLYVDTEGGSSHLVNSILKDNVTYQSVSVMEEWMVFLHHMLTSIRAAQEKEKSWFPVCFIIDSVSGSASRVTSETSVEQNFEGMLYPVEPRKLTTFFKQKTALLNKNPYTIVITNHVKQVIESGFGRRGPEEYVPGGKHLTYVCNIQLRVQKRQAGTLVTHKGKRKIRSELRISTDYNRLANEGRSILVPIYYSYSSPDNPDAPYEVEFDWYAATTFLLALEEPPVISRDERWQKEIKKAIQVERKSAGSRGIYYYSPTLGQTAEDAADATTFGEYVENHPDVKQLLYPTLQIAPAYFFKPNESYESQVGGNTTEKEDD